MNLETAKTDFARGNQLKQAGNLEEASAAYRRAIDNNPNFAWSYHNLGEVLTKQGKLEEAIVCYRKAIKVNPKSAWSHHNLGEALAEQCYTDDAITAYRCAINLNQNFYGFYNNLGLVLAKRGRLEEAVFAYRRAIELNPCSAKPNYNLGTVLEKQGLLKDAASCYRKAVQLDPSLYKAYYNLGNLLQRQGQLDEAVSCYIKVITIQPDFDDPYVRLELLPLNPPQLERAIRCCQKVIHQQPNLITPYLSLGDTFTKQGKIERAIQCHKQASYLTAVADSSGWFASDNQLKQIDEINFLIIGVIKSATTSLYSYIGQHPKVISAIKKEIHYFSYNFDKGLDWYLSHFPPIPEKQHFLIGEASPSYYHFPNAENRLFQTFPSTKLIIILRNPVNRTFSHYNHAVNWLGERLGFSQVIASDLETSQKPGQNTVLQSDYLSASLYINYLKKWMAVFPREQFLILRTEDLDADPAGTMKRVFEFLGLPDVQLPQYPRCFSGSYDPLPDDCRSILSDFFRSHNEELEEYLGMKFNWD